MSRARARAIEYARVQSEIKRNDAEAKKMEAEKEKLNESLLSKRNIILYIFSVIKYSIAGVILSCVLFAFALDTGKNLYDITSKKIAENEEIQKKISFENKKLKEEKEDIEKERNLLSHENKKLKLEKDIFQQERFEFAARIRVVEKRYVEALMRQAYSNAYNAYVQLVKRQEIYLPQGAASQRKAEKAYYQACQFLHEYWKLVVKMAEEPQADLFLAVKAEQSDWLQKGEQENVFSEECRTEDGRQFFLSPIQRKSLDLIERHVKQVRAGNSQFPDDLMDSFIDQPEFR